MGRTISKRAIRQAKIALRRLNQERESGTAIPRCKMSYSFHEGSLVQTRKSFNTWGDQGYNQVKKGTIAMVVKGPYPLYDDDVADILVGGSLYRGVNAKLLVKDESD